MPSPIIALTEDDMMGQLRGLCLPLKTALATYLKNNYGHLLSEMTDEDWLKDTEELLWALRLQAEPGRPFNRRPTPIGAGSGRNTA